MAIMGIAVGLALVVGVVLGVRLVRRTSSCAKQVPQVTSATPSPKTSPRGGDAADAYQAVTHMSPGGSLLDSPQRGTSHETSDCARSAQSSPTPLLAAAARMSVCVPEPVPSRLADTAVTPPQRPPSDSDKSLWRWWWRRLRGSLWTRPSPLPTMPVTTPPNVRLLAAHTQRSPGGSSYYSPRSSAPVSPAPFSVDDLSPLTDSVEVSGGKMRVVGSTTSSRRKLFGMFDSATETLTSSSLVKTTTAAMVAVLEEEESGRAERARHEHDDMDGDLLVTDVGDDEVESGAFSPVRGEFAVHPDNSI